MDTNRETWQKHSLKVRVAAGGRVVIPAEVRQALGIREGDEVLLTQDADGIRITTYRQAVKRAREVVSRYVRPGVSLIDELGRERAEEVAKEERATRDSPTPELKS